MLEPPVQTVVDDVHAHPRHVGHRGIDLMLALTALFISGISLYVAVDHGHTEQKLVAENAQLVQAACWPFLQLDQHYRRRGTSRIAVINAGGGLAKLQSLEVLYHGTMVPSLSALLTLCCGYASTPAARALQFPGGLSMAYVA